MIEENPHGRTSRLGETALRMLQYRIDLFPSDARKPFEKFVNRCTAFDIFEQSLHWYACALEKPGPADLSSNPFHGGTL